MNYIPNISNLNKKHADYKLKLIEEKEDQYQKYSQQAIKEVKEQIPRCIEGIERFYSRNGHFPFDVTNLWECKVDYSYKLSTKENYKRFKNEVKNIYGDNVNFVNYGGGMHDDPEYCIGIKPNYFK